MVNNLDLSAHAGEIASTHQRILSNDSSISWAVYGFDRGGVALNVQTEGNGPLDELSEEFDDGKVQFAFVRVQDPNTQLPKFVFISWCGQGVPVFRKGMVSSQVGEVQKVLTGSHVTIIARSEDDVQASEIMDKVERSSGAQYSYHTQPKRQPPMPAAKPAFASGQNVFKKNATYGAPTVGKGAGWGSSPSSSAAVVAAAVPSYAAKPVPKPAAKPGPQAAAAKPPVASPSIGGTKPLFGGASGAGRPVSSFFGARSPTAPSAAISPALRQNRAVSPPPVNVQEPDRIPEPVQSAYRSQQDERRAELDAIRRGSRGTSPTGVSGSVTPTSSSRLGAVTPNEPSSHFSQADQTKNELEMLRNRRLLNTGLGGSSGSMSTSNEVSERKAELDALRRGRGGSQSSMGGSQPSVPAHSWSQQQSGQEEETRRRQQQQEEEENRRRREQEEQDNRMRQQQQQQHEQEEMERRRREQQQQQQRQREEDEERRRKQQQEQEEQRRLRQQQEEERKRKMQQEQEQQRQRQLEEEKAATAAQPISSSSRGQKARALYDYDADAEDELPFNEGDIIYNVEQLDPGWWAGETQDGARQGVFPANFVELIDDEPVAAKPAPALPPASARAPPPPPALPAVPAPPALPAVAAPPPPPPVLPATAATLPPPPPPALPPMAPAPPAPVLPPPPSTAAAPPPAPMLPPMLPARGRDPPVQHPFGVPPPMSYTPEAPALPPRGAPAPTVAAPPSAPALPPRNAAPPLPPPPPPVAPAAAAPSQQQDLGQNHALAVYDYEAAEEGELSFSEGERITHIEFPSSEWWEGVNEKGEYGLFPANYVEIQQ